MTDIPKYHSLADGSISRADIHGARYARPFAELSDADKGWISRRLKGRGDKRSPTERDKDRVLYGATIHRLAGVTQIVTPPTDGSGLHSRLMHSFKVANLSREIAKKLTAEARENTDWMRTIVEQGGLDIHACEAAGLAHDIGHPPFGHVAEFSIDQWLTQARPGVGRFTNGFEGNAQSFRTVTTIERKSVAIAADPEPTYSAGLELTAVTLAGLLKYPWLRRMDDERFREKFGAYRSEHSVMRACRAWFDTVDGEVDSKREYVQTLEASVMDLADDITYAVHDLQDFLLAGLLPVEEVVRDLKQAAADLDVAEDGTYSFRDGEYANRGVAGFIKHASNLAKYYRGFFDAGEFKNQLGQAVRLIDGLSDFRDKDALERVAVVRTESAELIGTFVDAIEVGEAKWPDGPHIYLASPTWHLMQVLKRVTKSYVVETPLVGLHQAAQISSINTLLDQLELWCMRDAEGRYIPEQLQALQRLADNPRPPDARVSKANEFPYVPLYRAIVDYCCSLTDAEALQVSRYLQGQDLPRVI